MAFRSSTNATGTGTTITGTAPAGITAGDRLLVAIYLSSEVANISPPSFGEWKRVAVFSSVNDSGTGVNGQKAELWEVKNATASESYAFTVNNSSTWTIQTACFSGRSTSEPLVINPEINASAASPMIVTSSGVTATAAADLAFFITTDNLVGGQTWSFAPSGSYVERFDSAGAAGVSSTLATLDNVSAGATGNVTNTATIVSGSGNAKACICLVSIPANTDAQITTQPKTTITTEGSTASFSVSATGTGGLSYQWQSSTNGVDNWANVSGATSSTLSFTTTRADQNLFYRVIVTSSLDSVTSQAAKLDVVLLTYTTQKQRQKSRNHTFDLSGQGWFSSDLVQPVGLFDKDLATLSASADVTVAATGQQISSSIGNTVANNSVSTTGQQVALSVGQATAATASNVIVAATGQQIGLLQGSVGIELSVTATGQQSALSVGQVISNSTIVATGQQITSSQGTVTVSTANNVTVAATGQQIGLTQGNVGLSVSIASTGQQSTLQQGSVVPAITLSATGQSLSATSGNVSAARSIQATGQQVTLSQGITGLSVSFGATGQQIDTQQGTVTVSIGANVTVAAIGQVIGVSMGQVVASRELSASSQQISFNVGSAYSNIEIQARGSSISILQGDVAVAPVVVTISHLRYYLVPKEQRIFSVMTENRTHTVNKENRTYIYG